MKVALIARSSLFEVKGGDSIQVAKTASGLKSLGIDVTIYKASEHIQYENYDLLHFFNIIRPADHLKHINNSGKPYLVSTIYLDYSDFDRKGRTWLYRILFRSLGKYRSEYVKNVYRYATNQDHLVSYAYLQGHKRAMKQVLQGASLLLPNSSSEYDRLHADLGINQAFHVVTNGIDKDIFGHEMHDVAREKKVICVAQVYGMKNQHMLIHSCRELGYPLEIIGKPPPNHVSYYNFCRRIADDSVRFIDFMPQRDLVKHYASAEVHALPSWFETTGLTSLEAAAMGCKILVGTGGDTYDYFGPDAWYCNPSNPESIRESLHDAMESPAKSNLRQKIIEKHTWDVAARETLIAYKKVLYGKP